MKGPVTVELRERGQITLPKDLRQELGLVEREHLSVLRVGDTLVMTSKKLTRAALAAAVQKEMKEQKITLQDLLKDLKKQRERYHREAYGR